MSSWVMVACELEHECACLMALFKGDVMVVVYIRFPRFSAIFYMKEHEASMSQTGSRHVCIILALGQSQTSSSDFLRFGHVYLTDVGTIELPDEWDDPLDVDTSLAGYWGLMKPMLEVNEPLTCTTTNTSSKMEMGKRPCPK